MKTNKKWWLFSSIIFCYLIGVIGVGWNAYDTTINLGQSSPWIETLKIVFIAIGGLGIIMPTYLNVWQSIENNELHNEEIKRIKIDNTCQLLDRWDDEHLLKARDYLLILKERRNDLSDNNLIAEIEGDKDLRKSVILMLNYFDSIRVSIKHERVEKEIVKECLGRTIIDICTRVRAYIKEKLPPTNDIDELIGYLK